MKKVREIRNHPIRSARRVPRESPITQSSIVDAYAEKYLTALARADELKRALLGLCRRQGFIPKDAPKTKMLAGELYEVLASRATRTDVEQRKVRALRLRLRNRPGGAATFQNLFEDETIYSVYKDWQYTMSCPALRAGLTHDRLLKLFSDCLRLTSSRRLTVRKRKSAKSQREAA